MFVLFSFSVCLVDRSPWQTASMEEFVA